MRFCFYGTSIIASDDDEYLNSDNPLWKKIYYSLSSDSPYFLNLNPNDGCVRIAPYYRIKYESVEIFKYSVS